MEGQDVPRWVWALAGDYPFSTPPAGVKSNFEHPALLGYHSITIGASICMVVLLSVASARLYARLRLVRKWGADDYFFWASLPMLLTLLCFNIYLDNHGTWGHHAWDMQIKALKKPVLVVTYLLNAFTPITTWLVKTTLLCLLLTAFKPIHWLRYLCYAGIAVMFCFYLSNLAVLLHACRPQGPIDDRISWLVGLTTPKCGGNNTTVLRYSIATGVFNLLSDIFILLIPIPVIRKLQISKKKKVGVMLVFSAGGLACISSVLSLVFRIREFGTTDVTVATVPAITTNLVELSIGLTVSCFALVANLGRHLRNKYYPDTKSADVTGKSNGPYQTIGQAQRKKHHFPGGLSDIDTMKTYEIKTGTFGTVDVISAADSVSMKTLTSPSEGSPDVEDVEMQRVYLHQPVHV